jgi:putative ubiquitin-RnfH superfamily antitoxin RatB of RatAB toxin-antitoxin module
MADTGRGDAAQISVQVCYALPGSSFLKALTLNKGATITQAIEASGVLSSHPEIDVSQLRLGIFGKMKAADTEVREGDRIEIYRPLQADPKETRRRRAAHRKAAKD